MPFFKQTEHNTHDNYLKRVQRRTDILGYCNVKRVFRNNLPISLLE